MLSDFFYWVRQTRAAWVFSIVAFFLSLGYYALEVYNGRAQMADFKVYFDAANALMHNYQLYGVAFGISSGFYKYSPFAALVFAPLGLLKYGIASFIYYVLITIGAIYLILFLAYYFRRTIIRITHIDDKEIGVFLIVLTIFMMDHLERELHLGNVNLFLLILCFVCYLNILKRPLLAGVIYAIILLFKPHFIILLPYFIWKQQWKVLLASLAGFILGLLLPLVLVGWAYNLELHSQWLEAMQAHNVSLVKSPNTIYGILNEYLLQAKGNNWLILICLFCVGFFFLWLLISNNRKGGKRKIWFVEFFLLIGIIANLTHTDTEHFMWSMPILAYSLFFVITQSFYGRWLVVGLLVLAFVPYTLNSPDVVGKQARLLFDEGGLMGFANLIIVGVAVYIHLIIVSGISRRFIVDVR
jgi:alpha-1,2-mannosyltransferase